MAMDVGVCVWTGTGLFDKSYAGLNRQRTIEKDKER